MTAFAAVLSLTDIAPDAEALLPVASALAEVTGGRTTAALSGACALLFSPLHLSDPRGPVEARGGEVTCVGQVLLEGRRQLATQLGLAQDAAALDVVARAFDRWGPRYTERLSGEYAFVVWDRRNRRLTCARDGFGVRLLYVGRARDVIVASNVMDAVVAHPAMPAEIDERAIVRFLATGTATDGQHTPYRAVCTVPEGHTLTVSTAGTSTLNRHWWMPQAESRRFRGREEIVDGYRQVLRTAVDDRIGSAPATIFLSGGIDSATIAAAAAECGARLRAVTVEYARVDSSKEVTLASRTAEALSLPWSKVPGDRYEALHAEREDNSPPVPVDEPTLADWRAMIGAASPSTVAIYGEDGDALFAPPGWVDLVHAQSVSSIAFATAKWVASRHSLPYLGIRGRERLLGLAPAPDLPRWLNANARALLAEDGNGSVLGAHPEPLREHPTRSAMQRRLVPVVARYFADTISGAVTRQPVEITLPLLDSRVLQYVMSVPAIPWCHHKELARAVFRKKLPADVLARPKTPVVGFNDSLVDAWRRGPGRETRGVRPSSIDRAWIDEPAWVRAAQAGATDEAMAAWRLLMADAWMARAARTRGTACTR